MAAGILKIEAGFSAAPLDAISTITWTDLTRWVRAEGAPKTSRGRSDERGRIEAGTLTFTLSNRDRRFEPLFAGGAYYSNIKPMVRIRVTALHNAITYNLFHGYVESWEPSYPEGKDATVTVTAVDAFILLALLDLDNPYVMEVLKDSPKGYWRLNESGGMVAADSSGNGFDGFYVGSPTFSQSDPITDEVDGAVLFDGVDDIVDCGTNPSITSPNFSMEVWFRSASTSAQPSDYWFSQPSSSNEVLLFMERTGGGAGKVKFWMNAVQTISPSTYNDNAWHHAVGTYDGTTARLYVDGSQVATTATSQTIGVGRVSIGGAFFAAATLWGEATLDEAALYTSTLSSTRISVHYAARTAWLNQLSGTRINTVLDIIGWPTADRDVDAGQSTLQSAGDIAGTAALSHLLDVADWENGVFLIGRDGKARFDSRHARLTSPFNASQVTFAWTPSGSERGYSSESPSFNVNDVRNFIKITVSGGATHVAKDQASIDAYGKRVLTKTLKITSESEGQDAANWFLSHLKNPLLRVDSLEVRPGKSDALWVQCLTREIGDRITLVLRPPGGGAQMSKDFHIEHVSHDTGRVAADWTTTWLLSPADDDQYWLAEIAGFSEAEQTTRAGYALAPLPLLLSSLSHSRPLALLVCVVAGVLMARCSRMSHALTR